MTNEEAKYTILFLKEYGYTISGIYAVTGLTITTICEVIYEQNQIDKYNSGVSNVEHSEL